MARLLVNWGMRNGKNVFDLYKFMTGSQSERKRERESESNPKPKHLMILIVCLCRGLRESGRGAGLGRTWNGGGCGFAGRRILGWFRAQGQEGSRGGEGAGSPSIRRPLRRSGQITKGPVRVQRGTSRPPGSLSTSGQFASFPASSCSIGARDRLRSDHDPL